MADVTLTDGKEITFDLRAFSLGEYLGLFDPKESDARSDQTIARACGIEYKEFKKIPYYDYKVILAAFFKKCREPLSDPNSPSASTSPSDSEQARPSS